MPYTGFGVPNQPICLGKSIPITDDFYVEIKSTYGRVYLFDCYLNGFDNTCIEGNTVGTDYIYRTGTNACGTSTTGEWVTIVDKPTITIISPPDICSGSSVKLADSSEGFKKRWDVNNAHGRISGTGVFTGLSPGIAGVSLEVTNSCGVSTGSVNINVVQPGKIDGADSICIGGYTILADTIKGGKWSSNNANVATIDSVGKVTAIMEGYAIISYTTPGGCVDTAGIKVVTCDGRVSLFPNPVHGA